MTFEQAVAEWLAYQDRAGEVQEVVSVTTYGTDWAGDTEGGFYDLCDVTIKYLAPSGERKSREVSGEEMADLWNFVMKAWPTNG